MRAVAGGLILMLGGALVSAAGEGKNPSLHEVLKDMLATMDRITTSLSTIKDEETAKAARPELRKAGEHFVVIRKKADTLKPPTKEDKERLEKEFRPKLIEAQKKLFGEIGRVRGVPGGKEALQEISAAVNPAPKK